MDNLMLLKPIYGQFILSMNYQKHCHSIYFYVINKCSTAFLPYNGMGMREGNGECNGNEGGEWCYMLWKGVRLVILTFTGQMSLLFIL